MQISRGHADPAAGCRVGRELERERCAELMGVLWGLQPGLELPVLVAFDMIKAGFGLSTSFGLKWTLG